MKQKNWNRARWRAELGKLPAGLSAVEIARRFGKAYSNVISWLHRLKHPFPDLRGLTRDPKYRRFKPELVDWAKSNIDIARQWEVSRQRVQQVREREGKPKVNGRK